MLSVFIFLSFTLILFTYIFFINFSAQDDSYITFRNIDNFIRGFGLRWNIDERVMINVHPLWMFLVAGIYAISNNIYLSVFIISLLLSLAAILLVFYRVKDPLMIFLTGFLVCSSKAYMDYAGSGLENPLSYFLGILFVIKFMAFNEEKSDDNLVFVLFILGSLNFLSRYDTVLFFIPPLFYVLYTCWKNKRFPLSYILIGLLPALGWLVFSFIYYGFIFPNVFYASQNAHSTTKDFLLQGLTFYKYSFIVDPITFIVIFTTLILIIFYRFKNNKVITVFVGIVLYMLYIIVVGGTFMICRFFAMPFIMSLMLLIYLINIKKIYILLLSLLLLGYNIYFPYIPIKHCVDSLSLNNSLVLEKRVKLGDDHCFYHSSSNILSYSKDKKPFPEHIWAISALDYKLLKCSSWVMSSVGYSGYFSGPQMIIIDPLGITDPLLSHITGDPTYLWAHNWRDIPAGYIESRINGQNLIADNELHKYYEKIRLISRGDLFTKTRWKYILELNFTKSKYFDKKYKRDTECENNPITCPPKVYP